MMIEPALALGVVVISDRFYDSTTVYQGAARKLDSVAVEQLNRFAVGDHFPSRSQGSRGGNPGLEVTTPLGLSPHFPAFATLPFAAGGSPKAKR